MSRHVVALTVVPQAPIFELAIPCEVFGVDRSDLADPWYELRLCPTEPQVSTARGFAVQSPYGVADLADADTVLVGAGPQPVRFEPDDPLLEALREAHRRGARLAAICSGAYALAAAGLLDGRPATTHWMYAADFAARFPAVKVDPDVLYIDDGDILTSAGTGAAIDLCLHLVENDHGAAVANAVARRMVVAPHRDGGQAQYVQHTATSQVTGSFGAVLDWARANLDRPLTVSDLAERARLGQRTFVRRFADITGSSPLRWLNAERVRLAQQLLETTDHPIERIAHVTGFGTAANLRQHFSRATSVSPNTYRRVFRHSRSGRDVMA